MKISKDNIRFMAAQRRPHINPRGSTTVVLCFALAGAGLVAASSYGGLVGASQSTSSSARETITYGSRSGMTVTVVSKSGIDTPRAIISAEITEADARSYCEEYARDLSQDCVIRHIGDSTVGNSIQANCSTGIFSDFYGGQYRYGPDGSRAPNATIVNLKTGVALDDTAASGRSYIAEQFGALCPKSVLGIKAVMRPEAPPSPVVSGRQVTARSSGVLRGAIICPDLQTVRMLQSQNAQHWEETSQDALTGGRSKLIRGQAAPPADFAAFGCAFIPSGNAMTIETENPVPIVSATLADGTTIHGVTFSYMYGSGNSKSPW